MVAQNGTLLTSEICGVLRMRCFLSGMPTLKLGLNDKVLFESLGKKRKGVDLDDVKFHQCVSLQKFKTDRTITFVPPDGEFDLMNYRLDTRVKPLIWVESHVETHSKTRIEYSVKAKAQFKRKSTANNVEIYIPVPKDASLPSFKTTIGTCTYAPEEDAIVWSIKQFQGGKQFAMRAVINLPTIQSEDTSDTKRPITVKFEIPYYTVSGLQVRYLKIMEKSGYQALPWVRYITQSGDYLLRQK
jgi:AP-1 complex subunit mu